MKKTTIWISHDLIPMHSMNGWPELQSFEWHVGQGASGREYEELCENKLLRKEYEETVVAEYNKALAKAKKESIPLDLLDKYTHDVWDDTICKYQTSPPMFIEIEGEVEVVKQYSINGRWIERPADPFLELLELVDDFDCIHQEWLVAYEKCDIKEMNRCYRDLIVIQSEIVRNYESVKKYDAQNRVRQELRDPLFHILVGFKEEGNEE